MFFSDLPKILYHPSCCYFFSCSHRIILKRLNICMFIFFYYSVVIIFLNEKATEHHHSFGYKSSIYFYVCTTPHYHIKLLRLEWCLNSNPALHKLNHPKNFYSKLLWWFSLYIYYIDKNAHPIANRYDIIRHCWCW